MKDDHLWDIDSLDTEHLFRHLTEVNQKEARGGYLKGKLWFSPQLSDQPFALKITLIASEHIKNANNLDVNIRNMRIHPNLIYLTRFDESSSSKKRARRRDLEPSPPLWKIDLKISVDCETMKPMVEWWSENNAQPGGDYQFLFHLDPADNAYDRGGWILDIEKLNMTVITPLQRTNANGIKIKNGLEFRILPVTSMAELEYMEEDKREKLVRELERFYLNKDGQGKQELERICLQFDLHRLESRGQELVEQPISSLLISDPIVNTKSKSIGAFDLTGEISANLTCVRVPRKIYIFSRFPLHSEVVPRFVIKTDGVYTLNNIEQPKDIKVDKWWISFTVPEQDASLIDNLTSELYIEGYRPKDKFSTQTKIQFHYLTHTQRLENSCAFCHTHPDRMEAKYDSVVGSLAERAAPGTKRRRLTQTSSRVSSPGSTAQVSPRTQNPDDSTTQCGSREDQRIASYDNPVAAANADGLGGNANLDGSFSPDSTTTSPSQSQENCPLPFSTSPLSTPVRFGSPGRMYPVINDVMLTAPQDGAKIIFESYLTSPARPDEFDDIHMDQPDNLDIPGLPDIVTDSSQQLPKKDDNRRHFIRHIIATSATHESGHHRRPYLLNRSGASYLVPLLGYIVPVFVAFLVIYFTSSEMPSIVSVLSLLQFLPFPILWWFWPRRIFRGETENNIWMFVGFITAYILGVCIEHAILVLLPNNAAVTG